MANLTLGFASREALYYLQPGHYFVDLRRCQDIIQKTLKTASASGLAQKTDQLRFVFTC